MAHLCQIPMPPTCDSQGVGFQSEAVQDGRAERLCGQIDGFFRPTLFLACPDNEASKAIIDIRALGGKRQQVWNVALARIDHEPCGGMLSHGVEHPAVFLSRVGQHIGIRKRLDAFR